MGKQSRRDKPSRKGLSEEIILLGLEMQNVGFECSTEDTLF